jgi:ABC-type polysaccharide/polyol phosphate export permease
MNSPQIRRIHAECARARRLGRAFAQASGIVTIFADLLSEQWAYRELLVRMTARDLLLRYKQTVMGFGWAIFMPLVNTAIFSVIFTRVATIDVGTAYPVYAFCGLVAWNFFASALRFSVTSLTSNPSLVTKVYFPREIFPFSAVLVSIVDLAVALGVLAVVMAYYGVLAPHASLLLLPVVVTVLVLFTAAAALFLSMANLFYRDVKYLFEIVIAVWMFATSVVYPIGRVGGRLGAVLALNPMTHVVDAFRDVLIAGQAPGAAFWLTAVMSIVLLGAAWAAFHRAEFTFAENL